jgi:hypothetical protein
MRGASGNAALSGRCGGQRHPKDCLEPARKRSTGDTAEEGKIKALIPLRGIYAPGKGKR